MKGCAIIFASVACLWFAGAAVYQRDHLYGPRYHPLWPKGAKNNFTSNFGKLSLKTLIEKAGFVYENYTVTTEDGFILSLSRLVHPDNVDKEDKGYPILPINGFAMGGDSWLVHEDMDSNLAAVWAVLGYDVWIGDQRGTLRSLGHVKYNAKVDKEYWDHTIDEIGVYDYSAFIDFILEKTGHEDLVLACVSIGCGQHAALINARPEYNDKIRGAIYFMPLVNNIKRTLDMPYIFQLNMLFGDLMATAYERYGEFGIFPRELSRLRKELWFLCRPFARIGIQLWKIAAQGELHLPATEKMCYSLVSVGGAGLKSTRHVQQIYYKGEFAKYDYGREENMERYDQETSPLYDMSKIKSFVAVYYSDTDGYSTVEGTKKMLAALGGPTYECALPGFNHYDVILGKTFKYVLPDVVNVLDSLVGFSSDDRQKAMSGTCPSMEWIRRLDD